MSNQKRTLSMLLRATRALALVMLAAAAIAPARAQSPSSQAPSSQRPSTAAAPASAPSAPDKAGEGRANDFPTLARVEYVFECLSENSGPRHEMVYKCVCAVDRVAEAIPYDRWVDLSTFFKAQPMAGERGGYIRERSDIQAHMRSYREVQLNAKKACFIPTAAK